MKKIYIIGNPLLEFDNLPIRLKPRLTEVFSDIDFVEIDPSDNFLPDKNGELIIIDTVEGINEVKILEDIEKIQSDDKYSVHDYDLGMHLKLLQKLDLLKKVLIYCVPMDGDEEKTFIELEKLISIV